MANSGVFRVNGGGSCFKIKAEEKTIIAPWDVKKGDVLYEKPLWYNKKTEIDAISVNQAYLSPDDSILVVARNVSPFIKIYKWNGDNYVFLNNIPDFKLFCRKIFLSKDGEKLFVYGYIRDSNNTLNIMCIRFYQWNGNTFEYFRDLETPLLSEYGTPTCMTISDDNQRLFVGTDKTVTRYFWYDWNGIDYIYKDSFFFDYFQVGQKQAKQTLGMILCDDKSRLIIKTDNVDPVWYQWNGEKYVFKELLPSATPGYVSSFDSSLDGNVFVIGTNKDVGTINIYQWDGNKYEMSTSYGVIANISPDGNRIYSSFLDVYNSVSLIARKNRNESFINVYVGSNYIRPGSSFFSFDMDKLFCFGTNYIEFYKIGWEYSTLPFSTIQHKVDRFYNTLIAQETKKAGESINVYQIPIVSN